MKMWITKTFEIDEKIAPHIKKLNDKGYLTDMCCSGHPEEPCAGYITFDAITSLQFITYGLTLPNGWIYNLRNGNTSRINIRMINEMSPEYNEFANSGKITEEWIDNKLKALDEWIDSLPAIEPCMCTIDCQIIEEDLI